MVTETGEPILEELTQELERANQEILRLKGYAVPSASLRASSTGLASVMFLVAWHVALYLTCQFVEFSPAVMEWLNLAEVLFNLLQAKVLRRGVFPSKQALVKAIMDYIDKFNREGRTVRWTKTAEAIISSANSLTPHYMCHPNRRLAQHVVPDG